MISASGRGCTNKHLLLSPQINVSKERKIVTCGVGGEWYQPGMRGPHSSVSMRSVSIPIIWIEPTRNRQLAHDLLAFHAQNSTAGSVTSAEEFCDSFRFRSLIRPPRPHNPLFPQSVKAAGGAGWFYQYRGTCHAMPCKANGAGRA